MLVNAHDAKNVPGRKTDVSDATWLAQLGAHGLLRASFVPDEPIRRLRDLTRTRTAITRERVREARRLEKVLEDAGVKLSVVVSDYWECVACRWSPTHERRPRAFTPVRSGGRPVTPVVVLTGHPRPSRQVEVLNEAEPIWP